MKNTILGFLAAAVLAGAAFLVLGTHTAPTVPATQTPDSGSVTSAEIPGNFISVGSRVQWEYHIPMRPNASTTCQFISPNSTSTLNSLTAQIASSTTAANILEFGTSPSSSFATTTLIGTTYNIAAGARASIIASTTALNGSPILAPNTRVNIKVGQYAALAPVGTCNATFTVL